MSIAKSKLTKADLKRMEQLSAKLGDERKAIALEKKKIDKQKKEVEAEKKKLASHWKELKNQKKQAQLDKEFKSGVAEKSAKKADKKPDGGGSKKLQQELLEMKTKFNAEGKRARQFKQQVDQLTAENKVLQRKLKNLQGRKEKGEDPRIKNLLRENKQLKKQIKLLMIELNKKRRWFQRCIKSFKSSRQKWIAKQEEAMKKKGFMVKYVFLDDIKQIKAFQESGKGKKGKTKFKKKIKIKNRDGGTIVVNDVDLLILDGDDDDDDDDDSNSTNSKKGGKKKGGAKKKGNGGGSGAGKKSKGDKLDEMDAFLAELEAEIEADAEAIGGGGDEYKELDSDDDFDINEDVGDLDGDYSAEQLSADADAALGDDSDNEANDVGDESSGDKPKLKDMGSGGSNKSGKGGGKSPRSGKGGGKKADYLGLPSQPSIDAGDTAALEAQLVYLKKELDDRTDDVEKLKEIMSDGEKYPDPVGEVKQFMLNIKKRGDDMVDKMDKELHVDKPGIEGYQQGNDRWLTWVDTMSGSMAKNGALMNQLLGVYEQYLKELRGRIADLSMVNDSMYVDKGKSGYGDGFEGIKSVVGERHESVETGVKELGSKDDESKEEDGVDEEDKDKESLDKNTEKVKEVVDSLVTNNKDWRDLVDAVAQDYEAASQEKSKLVKGIEETNSELGVLMALIDKIPKRKILESGDDKSDEAGGDDDTKEDAEAAAGGDDDAEES